MWGKREACWGCWKQRGGGRDEGKLEALERGRSGRADEGSGLCPRIYGAGLNPMGGIVAEMTVDQSLDCPNCRQILLVGWTSQLNRNKNQNLV